MARVTDLVLLLAVVGLPLYDFVVYARHGDPATISRRALRWGGPVVLTAVFLAGVLFGHCFLPQHPVPGE